MALATRREHRAARNHLLNAAMVFAPAMAEQRGFVQLVHDMENAGESDLAINIALVGAIQDGIKHGNWPKA